MRPIRLAAQDMAMTLPRSVARLDAMTNNVGWVVEISTPSPGGAPTRKYYHVNISDSSKAVDAVSNQFSAPGDIIRAVRSLSSREIGVLKLQLEAIAPA